MLSATGLADAGARPLVAQRYPPAAPERAGQIAQAGDLLRAPGEPARHVQVHESRAVPFPAGTTSRRLAEPSRQPDLAVGRAQGLVQTELAQDAGHAQDKQGLGLVGTQAAQREPVAVHAGTATGTGLGQDGDPGRGQCLEVAVDRPDGDLELGRQGAGRRPAACLQQQDQGQQPVGAHATKTKPDR